MSSVAHWKAAAEQQTSSLFDRFGVGLIFVGVVFTITFVGFLICLFLKCIEKQEGQGQPTPINTPTDEESPADAAADVIQRKNVIIRFGGKLFELVFYTRRCSQKLLPENNNAKEKINEEPRKIWRHDECWNLSMEPDESGNLSMVPDESGNLSMEPDESGEMLTINNENRGSKA